MSDNKFEEAAKTSFHLAHSISKSPELMAISLPIMKVVAPLVLPVAGVGIISLWYI